MNDHHSRLVVDFVESYRRYRKGRIGLQELQGTVEAVLGAVDNSDAGLLRALHWIDSELETVRFMWPADEHQIEVAKRVSRFMTEIGADPLQAS